MCAGETTQEASLPSDNICHLDLYFKWVGASGLRESPVTMLNAEIMRNAFRSTNPVPPPTIIAVSIHFILYFNIV